MSSEAAHERKNDDAEEENAVEGPPWYAESKYNRYWTHYIQMKAWMQAQESLQTYLQDSLSQSWMQSYQQYYLQYQWWTYHNHFLHSVPSHHYHPQPYANWNNNQYGSQRYSDHYTRTHQQQHHHHHHHPYKPRHPATSSYRGNKQYVTDQSDVDYLDNGFSETQPDDEEEDFHRHGGEEEEEEEEFEVELSEEMRQFFLQSQKHREELKEMRQALNEMKGQGGDGAKNDEQNETNDTSASEDEFVISFTNPKKSKKKQITGAPSEQPGKRRAEEMKILYGKDSPAIHGMETAIQMQFDRNCDKKQPAFWPTVPLKM